MSCLDENQLLQYVEGLYDEEEARAIEAHLAECHECRFLLGTAGGAALEDSPSMAPTRTDATEEDDLLAPGASERKIGEVLQETYVVERFIGAGGMGAVYEVSHRRLARRFAIKFITEARVSDEEAVARMQREAYVTSRLSHPNIIQVTDFNYTDDGAPFIVMELLEGESLAELLMREGALTDLKLVTTIAGQVTSALEAAHREGIVHRDLTPGNIHLCGVGDGDPLVKLMDFGLSKIVERARHSATKPTRDLTRVVSVLGSPHFMSPEQATGRSANVDLRADIFSFGAILYRMLAGRPPFGGADPREVMRQVAFEDPARSVEWLRVPEGLRVVVERALRKEAPRRQRSMAALWAELEPALEAAITEEDSWVDADDAPTEVASASSARVSAFRSAATSPGALERGATSAADASLADPSLEEVSIEEVSIEEVSLEEEVALAAIRAEQLHDEESRVEEMPAPARVPRRRRGALLLGGGLFLLSALIITATAMVPCGGGQPSSLAVERGTRRVDFDAGARADDGTSVSIRRPAAAVAGANASGSAQADAAVAARARDAGGQLARDARARPRRRAAVRPPPRRRPRRQGPGALSVQTISVDGKPLWADLYIDGRKVGQTALTLERVAAGRHRVEVRRAGYRPAHRTVRVRPDRRLRLQLQMRKAP